MSSTLTNFCEHDIVGNMSHSLLGSFNRALKEHLGKLVMLAAIFGFIAFMVAVFQPREYRATGRLLIVPRGAVELDAYTAARAGERLGNILKEVVYSNSFLDRVLASGQVRSDYAADQIKRLKLWKRRVGMAVSETSGVLTIDAYNVSRTQAETTANVIFGILKSQGPSFYGGKGVDIQLVESPVVSQEPVRPKLGAVTLGGAAAGFIVGAGLIFLMAPEMARRRAPGDHDIHDQSPQWV